VSQIPSSVKPQPGAADGTGSVTPPTCEIHAGSMRDNSTGSGFCGSVTSVRVTPKEKVEPWDLGLSVCGPAVQTAWIERSGRYRAVPSACTSKLPSSVWLAGVPENG